MLAVTGSSVHSGRITGHGSSRGRSSARKHKKHHHHHHHHHPHEPLRVSLAKATAESSNNVRETLRTHLEPHLAGGLSALFVAFRFMIEDHGLSLGSGEVKDVLISLGFTAVTSDDALALHKVLLGPNRQRKKALRLHDVATILGTPENTVAEDSKLGEKSTTKTLKEGGGHNAQQLHNLVGDTITRHVKKAIVRSETRQHKGWLVQPTDKLLERLRHKMKEHLPGTASYLETFRLFKHGHGADISLEEFRHTIRDDFGLAVPEKRLRRLFETFDTQRKGTIDFGDFVAHVWEPNIRRESVILRDDIQKQKLKRSLAKAQKQYETSSIGPLSLEAAAQIIRDKLSAHIQGGHVLQAFREFHHGHGKMEITRPEFMHEIKVGLGIKLAREPEDYDALFDHFDTDGDGSINFQEFTHELLHDEAIGMSGGGGADDTSQRFNPVTAHQSSVMLGPNVNIKSVFKNRLLAHLDSGPNEISRAFHKLKMYGDGKARNNLAGVGLQDFIAAVGRLGMSVEQRRVETLFREIAGRDATLMTLEAFRDGLFKETYSSSISFGSNQNNKKLLSQQKSADVTRVQRKLNKLRDDTDVRNLIKTKLEEKLSGGANALLRAFRSFHSGHGLEISEAEFHKVVNTLLEISMPREETLLLFQEIDTDGNG
jgi:Ca2+-binding EF-hand superfamily protein